MNISVSNLLYVIYRMLYKQTNSISGEISQMSYVASFLQLWYPRDDSHCKWSRYETLMNDRHFIEDVFNGFYSVNCQTNHVLTN